jgi:hypothetical protein
MEILKKKIREVNLEVPGGSLVGGRLSACQVHDGKTKEMIRRIEFPGNGKPNYMFRRIIDRLCTFEVSTTRCIEDEFAYSRLGTGAFNGGDKETMLDLVQAIPSSQQYNNQTWVNTVHLPTNTAFNLKSFLRRHEIADAPTDDPAVGGYNTAEAWYEAQTAKPWWSDYHADPSRYIPDIDGDFAMTVKISHAHPEYIGSGPIQVREIGYSDQNRNPVSGSVTSQTINSRVELSTPVTLEQGQYLVTTYTYELRLPSFRVRSFSNIGITGLSNSTPSGRVRFTPTIPTADSTIAGSTRSQEIYLVQRALTNSAVVAYGYVASSADDGVLDAYGFVSSRLGGSTLAAFPAIGDFNHCPEAASANTTNGSPTPFTPSQPAYTGNFKRTMNFWRQRAQSGTDYRSLFCFGYQFLLDNPFTILYAQDIAVSATLSWNLMQAI